jgi:ribonucleoside-diphosphate reductase alpha chain
MDNNLKLLSDIVTYVKYSRFLPSENRRETWPEICSRLHEMHTEQIENLSSGRNKDFLLKSLDTAMQRVEQKQLLPSMRSMQFAGDAIKKDNARIFNCSFMSIHSVRDFWEITYLLLCGCGVGYSVEIHNVLELPARVLLNKHEPETFVIPDSKEGWASAVFNLVNAYLVTGVDIEFNYDRIRPAGAELKTSGGMAPGPEALRRAINNVRRILESIPVGGNLKPIEVHDIVCFIGECIVSGGIRRSALISLFSLEDKQMFNAKAGDFDKENPQRYMANNSAVLNRGTVSREQFAELIKEIVKNGRGEPGIFWTSTIGMGTNPCAEIALRDRQFCNLVEIGWEDDFINPRGRGRFLEVCDSAALLGTIQASYTNFQHLSKEWTENTEHDALIGVGITGLAKTWGLPGEKNSFTSGAALVRYQNATYARMLGINPAKRTTTVKPAGSTSCVLGCSSGVHPYHSDYYLRRIRLDRKLGIYRYLKKTIPELMEEIDIDTANIAIPIAAPQGAVIREGVSAKEFLQRILDINRYWIHQGDNVFMRDAKDISNHNFNNVSCSISYAPEDVELLTEALWVTRNQYASVSLFPIDETVYEHPPHETITESQFQSYSKHLKQINFGSVIETEDLISFESDSACAGGNCEVI